MFDIYTKYSPQGIIDRIGWKNCVEIEDLSTAIMVLCDIVIALQARVNKLEKAAKSPDPLGEALNSGDGSYSP